MATWMNKLRRHSLPRFLAVGVLNTALSAVLMFVLYDAVHLGYWPSTALSYLAGAIVSFLLNRRFTFQSDTAVFPAVLRFALTVFVCYLLAYSAAKPLILWIGSGFLTQDWAERVAMLCGMALYTALNYIGQRFFAFAVKNKA